MSPNSESAKHDASRDTSLLAAEELEASRAQMLADVVAGLSSDPRTLPSKYFYDEVGSRLFDEITELPEYYLTRTETAIMERHVGEMAAAVGSDALLVEFGSGSSVKTKILLDALDRPAGYVPIDISGDYLEQVAERLREEHPGLDVLPLVADFTQELTLPTPPRTPARRVVYFPGSTIGNFSLLEAARLLTRTRRLAGPGGGVLMGFDRIKPLPILHAAYNDAAGVTAEFNKNLLLRLNHELGANIDVDAFRHEAPFNAQASRIEMHLVSERDQTVRLGSHVFDFADGDRILTEHSHKYSMESFAELASEAGLVARQSWTDDDAMFCVQYLEPLDG